MRAEEPATVLGPSSPARVAVVCLGLQPLTCKLRWRVWKLMSREYAAIVD